MASKLIGATLAVVAGAAMVAGPAVGAAVAAPSHAPTGVVRMDPPHDPHCTQDGMWHNNPGDPGHPDARCHRW
jgi:poly(3-hydroxybutyrate) depolymerase